MNMAKVPYGAIIGVVLLIASAGCDTGNDGNGGSAYEFIERELQGVHSATAWVLASGYAEDWVGAQWSIRLYDIEPTDGIDPWALGAYPFSGYRNVFFDVPKEPDTGLYELSFSFSDDDFTVTFYDPAENLNVIADEGAVEILEIDTVGGTIRGRMHVWASADRSGYTINGNFSVSINPDDLP